MGLPRAGAEHDVEHQVRHDAQGRWLRHDGSRRPGHDGSQQTGTDPTGGTRGADDREPRAQAREIADAYVRRVSPGTQAGEAEEFYGYYTLHTENDGEVTGVLSVNGYSGEVWYHSWHGPFIAMEEE